MIHQNLSAQRLYTQGDTGFNHKPFTDRQYTDWLDFYPTRDNFSKPDESSLPIPLGFLKKNLKLATQQSHTNGLTNSINGQVEVACRFTGSTTRMWSATTFCTAAR